MEMKGTFKLKKSVTSKKFGVVFPANIELNGFVDNNLNIYAEHPKHTGVHIRVKKSNILNPQWDWKREKCNQF
jgi:hypothetical protein